MVRESHAFMQRPRPGDHPTLLIDAMGTLVTLADPVPALRAELSRRLGIELEAAPVRAALGAEVAYYRTHMQDGVDEPSLAALRERCAAVLAAALGPPAADAAPAVMTEVLLASLRFVAFADAAPALRRVRAAGTRIVVVSNWDVSLLEVLEQTGLAPLLDAVVTSAAVGARKPDPAIFAAALALAGGPAVRAVHVGDSPTEDVAGARACGIRPVLLDRSPPRAADRRPAPAALDGVEVIPGLEALPWP